MVWKNNYWRYLIVFLLTLIVSIGYLNQQRSLVLDSDSESYLQIAKQIKNEQLPDFSVRTPTYPLFLSFFILKDNCSGSIVWANILIGSVGAMFYLWFLDNLSKKKWLNMMIVIFLFMDYGVINFENVLLTESIGPTVMIFSIYANLLLIKKAKEKTILRNRGLLVLVLFGDFLLMFLKPFFILLPLVMKTYLYIQTKYLDKKIFKKTKKGLLFTGGVNIILIIAFLSYNFFTSGKFELSYIGVINTFGKVLNLGFLEKNNMYKNMPKSVEVMMGIYDKYGKVKSPWDMKALLVNNKFIDNEIEWYNQANRYFFSYPRNCWKYVFSVFCSLPASTTEMRWFYSQPSEEISENFFFIKVNNFFESINGFKFLGLIIVLGMYFVFLRKKSKKALYFGIILIATIYTLMAVTFFSYAEFFRLRLPVEIFLNLFVLLPLLFIKAE